MQPMMQEKQFVHAEDAEDADNGTQRMVRTKRKKPI
jgi:hypothetical protein